MAQHEDKAEGNGYKRDADPRNLHDPSKDRGKHDKGDNGDSGKGRDK